MKLTAESKLNGERIFASVPENFDSPFPSNEAMLDDKFRIFLDQAGLADELSDEVRTRAQGIFGAAQGEAFVTAAQIAMKQKAILAGDLLKSQLDELVLFNDAGELGGLFAGVTFNPTTAGGVKGIRNAMGDVAFDLALNAISAIPIVGNIAGAIVGVAKNLFRILRAQKDEQPMLVPWREYSDETDTDLVNKIIVDALMPGVDWTPLFAPSLDTGRGWSLERTKKGGRTRAWGIFSASGEPMTAPGLGVMPGTQRGTDVVQLNRWLPGTTGTDHLIRQDTGDFFPAVAQSGTALWQAVNREGSPDMYKVQAGALLDAWETYFGSFFDDAARIYKASGAAERDRVWYLSVAASSLLFLKNKGAAGLIDFTRMDPTAGAPRVDFDFERMEYRSAAGVKKPAVTIFEAVIEPACKTLVNRQILGLLRSNVCAFVRDREIDGMPPYAAFSDPRFGRPLRATLEKARALFLKHPARWEVDLDDAAEIDPIFAAQILESRGGRKEPSAPPRFEAEPLERGEPPPPTVLEPDAPELPPAEPPKGGAWGAPDIELGKRTGGFFATVPAPARLAAGVGALWVLGQVLRGGAR